jgi:hypothetical protein
MAEPTNPPAGATDPAPIPDPKVDEKPQGDTTDWKAEARKWEDRAKADRAKARENEDAAKRLKDLEDSDKTELQKATDAANAATKRADEAESRALRLEIAHEKGLTPAQAKRLVGGTREELEADADELVETFAPPAPDKTPSRSKPTEALRPGASADKEPEPSGKEIAEEVLKENRW